MRRLDAHTPPICRPPLKGEQGNTIPLGQIWRDVGSLLRKAWSAPLEWRFLFFSVVVLVAGAFVIGNWISGEIKDRVIQRSAATNALYVDSFVSPLVAPLERSSDLPPENVAALEGVLADTALGDNVLSFKIWSLGGEVVFATEEGLMGQTYPVTGHLQQAFGGEVTAHVSNLGEEENEFERLRWSRLLETYAPVRSHETGRVIAVSEFYQHPDDILGEVRSSQTMGWMIVAGATLVMFLVLNGMVRQAGATIRKQNAGLRQMADQLRAASASKVQTEEQVMSRIAQDLHDGPAQRLSVALLRLGPGLGTPPNGQSQDSALVREAVHGALTELRGISNGIRLPDLEELNAQQLVLRAVTDFGQKTGRLASCRTAVGGARLSSVAKLTVYRIIQEALYNSFLHAEASAQEVTVSLNGDRLEMEITDDGLGFNPDTVSERNPRGRVRLGIRGMRERAELLGGTLSIDSKPGAGTRVLAWIPTERRTAS